MIASPPKNPSETESRLGQYRWARWYDAEAGRWISEDPLGFAAGDANLNRHVGNGGTGGTDPTGFETVSYIDVFAELYPKLEFESAAPEPIDLLACLGANNCIAGPPKPIGSGVTMLVLVESLEPVALIAAGTATGAATGAAKGAAVAGTAGGIAGGPVGIGPGMGAGFVVDGFGGGLWGGIAGAFNSIFSDDLKDAAIEVRRRGQRPEFSSRRTFCRN